MEQLDDRVMLSGKAILSTILTMGEFGDLADAVLKKYGINEINQNKNYPFEIRSRIHEAALKKYGPISLVAFGFKSGEMFREAFKDLSEKCDHLSEDFCSKDKKIANKALSEAMLTWAKLGDQVSKMAASSKHHKFFTSVKEISDAKFLITNFGALKPYQSPFMEGLFLYIFTMSIGRYWDFKVTLDSN